MALHRKSLYSKQRKGINLKVGEEDKAIDMFLEEQRVISELNDQNNKIVDVKGDGNCLFRCFALSLLDNEDRHK